MNVRRLFKRLVRYFTPDKWLFLDDTRNPPAHLSKIFYVVRSYDEFVDYIETYGVPEVISFDHDLHPEHTSFFFERGGFRSPPDPQQEIFKNKTGYDCAEWLLNYCDKNNFKLKIIVIHSHNPLGSSNLYQLISSYQLRNYKKINCKLIRWKQ